ncbi:MAG: hypothetical protein IT196_15350 [Acidimicrobiales bacterium]|nr:hypothetical protein [Acidimicrobiales bacterium]
MWWWTLPTVALVGLAGQLVRQLGKLERCPDATVTPGDNLRARAATARAAVAAVVALQQRSRALHERLDRPAEHSPAGPPARSPGAETPRTDH